MPYITHAIAEATTANQSERAGSAGISLSSRRSSRAAIRTRAGMAAGANINPAAAEAMSATPNEEKPSSSAPVIAATTKPAIRLMTVTTSADPAATAPDTPRC